MAYPFRWCFLSNTPEGVRSTAFLSQSVLGAITDLKSHILMLSQGQLVRRSDMRVSWPLFHTRGVIAPCLSRASQMALGNFM